MTKKNNNAASKGNITIIVLIIGMIVILATSAMISFMIRDIKFTKLDENKLRALNFSEAGISYMYSEIDKYYSGETASLPFGPYPEEYTGSIESGEGSFTVSYEVYPADSSSLVSGYAITSKGMDKSGVKRTVRVNVLTFNIFNFLYSQDSLNYGDIVPSGTTIDGPFFTNSDLNLRGRATFLEGPLMVGGSMVLGGNSALGEEGNLIDLFLGGSFEDVNGTPIKPPFSSYSNVFVDDFCNNLIDLSMLNISDDYVNSLIDNYGALEIPGDLYIKDGAVVPEIVGNTDNYMYFSPDGILHIKGNIVVRGNIDIGKTSGEKFTINYQGKAKLVATGNINVNTQVIPVNDLNYFPGEDLLILVSQTGIYIKERNPKSPSYSNPNIAAMMISSNLLKTEENTVVRGGLISGTIELDNNTYVYYEPDIGSSLPEGMPETSNIIFAGSWQEIQNQ